MILLQAVNIAKSFGAQNVLHNVNFILQKGERAGIVGVNGAGKSTLLKIITGALTPDRGEIVRAKDLTVSYMAQGGGLESEQTIRQEMFAAFAYLRELEQQLREMEKRMGDPAVLADEKGSQQLLQDYDSLSAAFQSQGGFSYEAEIRGVLRGLNFNDSDDDTPVRILSGGQKTRLALARCLLGAPDLLILDEPTNYLDLDNLAWLEQYLQTYRGTVLTVSHDRYFLDALVQVVYDLDGGTITRYPGNYTAFVRQKTAGQEQQLKAYKKQQEEIARAEDFVRRNIAAKDTTKRAQSRLKALEKMERLEPPTKERRVHVSFQINRTSGQEVLQTNNLTIGYPGTTLAQGLHFGLTRGERVVLIGPNGTGKSTLLKTIAGLLPPPAGHFRLGTLVQIGYYEQEHQGLHQDKDVLHELWDRYPHSSELEIRTALGGFLFSGDEVLKKVADLSGGERARLALAALMLHRGNFLLLDEPTNHLDLPGKEALEDALADYPGTILFVSHDRYFINKVAGRVLELTTGQVTSYAGNYDYYRHKKNQSPSTASAAPDKAAVKAPTEEKKQYFQRKEEERQKRKQQREIANLEQAIAQQEELLAHLAKELEQPEVYQDYQACQKVQSEIDQARHLLDEYMGRWLILQEQDSTEA